MRRIGWAAYPTMHRRGVVQRNMTRGWLSGRRTRRGRSRVRSSRNSARLLSDFGSDQVGTSNAAFECRRSRMEMQQVGADSNELCAQPRRPLYLKN
jgi:hypothetical protein